MQTRASFILIFLFIMLSPMRVSSQIVTGAEQMDQYMPLLKGKRIGMVVNHTSVVGRKQVHLLDTLLKREVRVVKVFAPEHGFRGNADAGETVKDGKDSRTGIPIVSLYGDNKEPSAAQLKDVDVIVFDIQDVYSYKPQPYAEERIYGQISDITISMKSTDHLKMPELISSEYEVHLSDDEVTRYEELKQELVLELPDGEITAANAASLTGKLSQLANGAIYSDTGDTIEFHDRKLDALEDIIESANGKPVLVAYWFKHDLSRIKKRFDVREIKSTKDITDWNDGKIPVAVIHPASAGHGLNLQAGGSTLIWFGLTWSLELYQQTNARLWRQGQTSGTVVIEHIITKGTIDERILKALSKKELTQNALIDAVKANL